ncbi:MAG: bifunctional serine/threonine-protein kinase/formylglycine-generating enzyme family protein [Calothrix sp. MO_167.B12]|nr:bifunctional serine/threonine-protein kinase/formylglycine-generating enzyme family protein [Calothrix sp. MO_167.B12]
MVWNRGKKLFGNRYIIERKLGEGGVGITYLAKNRHGKLRVIKTLREQILNDPAWQPHQGKLKQDFKDEALRLALCRHPHIVEVENVFDDGDLPCMVMEYIQGSDLVKRITTKGALPEAEALLYIRQIGDALTVVHERGLLHRDLKPSNIMMRQGKPEAVLIDFGIARQFIPGVIQQHTVARTPGFAPPEQYVPDGERGEYIDVYGLAATLYSLLTGQLPTPAEARLQNRNLVPPQSFYPSISNRVNDAIMKGMALNYKFRPQSVQEWLDLLGEEVITPTPPKTPPVKSSQGFSQRVNVSPPQQPVINLIPQPTPITIKSPPPTQPNVGLPLKTFSFETVTVKARGKIINRRNLQAKYFVEDLGNGVTLEMVQIPGGIFTMGSPKGEKGRFDIESPQHTVTVQPFFMGKYVVTQEQYEVIMGKNPSYFKNETTKNRNKNRPVERVSWYDAVEFCARLSKATGKEYRLPSEAEWEYACRAGTTKPFYFGKTITTDLVNYNGIYTYASAPKGEYRRETTDVGIFPPNAFGLYDMHGNVFEWCADPWHNNYEGAPKNGRVWLKNGDDNRSPLRGGSWFDASRLCRSGYRNGFNSRDNININVGFRVSLCGWEDLSPSIPILIKETEARGLLSFLNPAYYFSVI